MTRGNSMPHLTSPGTFKPTPAWVQKLADQNCLYVTTYPGSDVYYEACQILPQELWPLSGWAILGQLYGHEWCACSHCFQLVMMAPRKKKCAITAGCDGDMERIVPRPRLTKKIKGLIEL